MNSRERVLNALALQKSDRIPVVPFITSFAANFAGCRLIDYLSEPNILANSQIAVARRFKIDAVYVDSNPVVEIEATGAQVRYFEDESPMAVEPALKASRDVHSLRVPDPEKDIRLIIWLDALRILKDRVGEDFAVFAHINGPFAAAAQLLGILETSKCMRRSQSILTELLNLTTQTIVSFMKAEVQAGVDATMLGDPMSSTSVISPREFEQFTYPYIRKVIHEAGSHTPFILHICGDATRIIDKMVEARTRYLEVDSTVDLGQVRKRHGDTVGLLGNVNPTLLLTGMPAEVEESCRKAIEAGGLTGAYILGTGCELPRNTPHANLDAMVSAVDK